MDMMLRLLLGIMVATCLTAHAQVSYWFSQWQKKPDAKTAQEFFMVPGANVNFTYAPTNRVIINASGGGGIGQTNISYTAVTNAPWQFGCQNLTNWCQISTNSLGSLIQTNISYTAVTNAPWQWGCGNLTNWCLFPTNVLGDFIPVNFGVGLSNFFMYPAVGPTLIISNTGPPTIIEFINGGNSDTIEYSGGNFVFSAPLEGDGSSLFNVGALYATNTPTGQPVVSASDIFSHFVHTNGNSYGATFSNSVTISSGLGDAGIRLSNEFAGMFTAEYNGSTWFKVKATTGSGQTSGIWLGRGTTNDNITDWTIVDTSGNLSIFSLTSGSSSERFRLPASSGDATVIAGGCSIASANSFNWNVAGGAYISQPSTGNILASNNVSVVGSVTPTNGLRLQTLSTNGFTICTTNKQFYMVNSSTNPLFVLPNAANVPGVIYYFSSTNYGANFIVTNATGTQTIRNGSDLSYTNTDNGIKVVSFISDGAAWWLASKGKVTLPNASWSCSTNTRFLNVTNTITLDTQENNNGQGIFLDNSAWFTPGVGSRIWVTNAGQYLITFSAVWSATPGGPANGDIWLRQNSIDIPRTMTLMTIQNNTSTNVMTVNFIIPVTGVTYFDLQGASPSGAAQLQAMPAITSPFNRPACPSIIVTVNKVSD